MKSGPCSTPLSAKHPQNASTWVVWKACINRGFDCTLDGLSAGQALLLYDSARASGGMPRTKLPRELRGMRNRQVCFTARDFVSRQLLLEARDPNRPTDARGQASGLPCRSTLIITSTFSQCRCPFVEHGHFPFPNTRQLQPCAHAKRHFRNLANK